MRHAGRTWHLAIATATLVVGALAAATPAAGAADFRLEFGVAPRLDATFTSFIGGTVAYDAAWYSSVFLEYETEKVEDDRAFEGYSGEFLTDASSFSVDLDLLGLNLLQGAWRLGVAGSAEYILFGALETARYTADEGFVMVPGSATLDVSNNRSLQVLLPTVDARFEGSEGPLYLAFGGEYSPAIFVLLDQTLSTTPVYPGATDDGPLRSTGFYESAQSFSVNGAFRLTTDVIAPELSAEYTRLPIAYTLATLVGTTNVDTVIQELSVTANVGLTFLNILGFYPTFQSSFERSWSIDRLDPDPEREVDFVNEWLFYFGARRLP